MCCGFSKGQMQKSNKCIRHKITCKCLIVLATFRFSLWFLTTTYDVEVVYIYNIYIVFNISIFQEIWITQSLCCNSQLVLYLAENLLNVDHAMIEK